MIRLVVDAAELGRSAEIDAAIWSAHRDGVVTSTSLIGNTERLEEAARGLAGAPRLGVGLALALIRGRPLAPPATVPTLVAATGELRETARRFAVDWARGRISADEVELELDAQIVRALRAGLPVDHLCTVGHIGFLPGIGGIVERLARRHRIAGIRSDVEPPTLSWITEPGRGLAMGLLSGLAFLSRRKLGALGHGPQTWGYMEAGRLDEIRILELIGRMGPGAHEMICHPTPAAGDGAAAGGDAANATATATRSTGELAALTSTRVRQAIENREIVLCRWRDLF